VPFSHLSIEISPDRLFKNVNEQVENLQGPEYSRERAKERKKMQNKTRK